MPRVQPIATSFNAGEWAPYMAGRIDLQKYASASRRLRNMIPLPQGPATRRPGFRYAASSKGDADGVLIPFRFSTVQAYVIEATDLAFRFYKDKGRIELSGTPVEVATPYTLADLAQLQWVQSTDTLYLVHPNHAPRKLTRTGHTSWTLSTISFTAPPANWTGSNWPGAVAFHQARLFLAGTPNKPDTIWASKSGDYENFTQGSLADDGLEFTIADGEVNKIEWLVSQKALLVGTAGGEFSVRGSSLGEALTPDNIVVWPETQNGSARVPPLRLGAATLYVQRAARQVFEMVYSFQEDAQISPELSLLARHIPRPGIRRMAWQRTPWSVVWLALEDGQLAGVTYMRDQQVVGWHLHPVGGTNVKVRSLACIPNAKQDEVWALIERTIDGATKRYVEVMEDEFEAPADRSTKDAFFVDSGLTYSGAPVTAVTGLAHLKGETVQILADGATHPDKVVAADGSVALDRAAAKIHIGLQYKSRIETLPFEAGAANGTAQTKTTRVIAIAIRFVDTLLAKAGYSETESGGLEEILFRDPSAPMDAPPKLFTGTKETNFPSDWRDEATILVVQDRPLPLTIAAMVPLIKTNDG
jgi:hypothetical protein